MKSGQMKSRKMKSGQMKLIRLVRLTIVCYSFKDMMGRLIGYHQMEV